MKAVERAGGRTGEMGVDHLKRTTDHRGLEDFRRELKEARECDAVIEEERELARSRVAEPNSHFQA